GRRVIEQDAMTFDGLDRAIGGFHGSWGLGSHRLGFLGLGIGGLHKRSARNRSRAHRTDNECAAAFVMLAHDSSPIPLSSGPARLLLARLRPRPLRDARTAYLMVM